MKFLTRYYPALIIIYIQLHLFIKNFDDIEFMSVIRVVGISISLFFGIYHVLKSFFKYQEDKVTLSLFVVGVIFFTLGHWYFFINTNFISYNTYLEKNWHHTQIKDLQNIVKFIYILSGGVILYKIRKITSTKLKTINTFLAISSFLLFMFSIIEVGALSIDRGLHNDETNTAKSDLKNKDHDNPDIFFIVYDGYPSNYVLNKYYNFNNSSLVNMLSKKGFNIPKRSFSNYNTTYQSFAAILNMEYHDELYKKMGPKSSNRRPMFNKVENNKVLNYLKEKGYKYYHLQSYFSALRENKYADENVLCDRNLDAPLWELLKNSSALMLFKKQLRGRSARVDCHQTNLTTLLNFSEKEKYPFFVLAHFFPPHPPYLFNEDGVVKNGKVYIQEEKARTKHWQFKKPFLSQLKFINKQISTLVSKLLSRKRKPVIVIMSDHGPRLRVSDTKESDAIRFSNFTAIYLPNKQQTHQDEIISSNVFRIVFNKIFNDDFKMLKRKNISSTYSRPYRAEIIDANYIYIK